MAYCSKCNKQEADGIKFCQHCGGTMIEGKPKTDPKKSAKETDSYDPAKDAADNKWKGIIAYLVFFVPLIMGAHRTSQYVKYHTNQGLVLFIFYVAFGIIFGILSAILGWAIKSFIVWSIVYIVLSLLWIVPVVFLIIGILNASRGLNKPLPVIGKITIIK